MSAETPWSSDVPISMPIPTDNVIGVSMSGFAFTDGGIAHEITRDSYQRLSVPDFAPSKVPSRIEYEDEFLDRPPASVVTF